MSYTVKFDIIVRNWRSCSVAWGLLFGIGGLAVDAKECDGLSLFLELLTALAFPLKSNAWATFD